MHIASSMKNISQDILNTHHTRTKDLNDLRTNTLNDLSADVKAMFKGFAADAKMRVDFINNDVKQFVSDLKEAEIESSKERADFAKMRTDFVNDIKQATHELKNETHEHIHEIRNQIHDLKDHVKELFEETRAQMAETRADMAEAKKAWASTFNKATAGLKTSSPQPTKSGPRHKPQQKPKGGRPGKKAE